MNRKFLVKSFLNLAGNHRRLVRTLAILSVVGFIGFMIAGGLLFCAGITIFERVSTQIEQSVASNSDMLSLGQVQKCLGKAQSFLALEPWLDRPVLENLSRLKVACLEPIPPANADEGKVI